MTSTGRVRPEGPTTLSSAVELRRTFGAYPTGVVAVAGLVGQPPDLVPAGLAASSFTPVSLQPPLVSFSVAHTSTTWPYLKDLPRIGISVLSVGQEPISRRLGECRPDRFAGVGWEATGTGAVILAGAAAWFEVSLERQIAAGDHDILLFEVHGFEVRTRCDPEHPDERGSDGRGEVEVLDLAELTDRLGAPLGAGSAERWSEPLARIHAARVLVVPTPTNKGSYTGLLKSFLDHVSGAALQDIVAIPVTTVGSPAHTLAADVHLRPLLTELGASTPTGALVVGGAALDDPAEEVAAWLERNDRVLRLALGLQPQPVPV